MKNYLKKVKLYFIAHKTFSIIALIIILLLGYWIYGKITSTTGETRYVISAVSKGTIISTVDGTGQVSASTQVDLKPKVSGDINYIAVVAGQKVSAGAVIAGINNKDAQKILRDAQINLDNAKLSLEKLKIQNSDANMNSDLQKAYDDGFTSVSDTFLDLPSTITGLENILNQQNVSDNAARVSGNTAISYREDANTLYYQAKNAFDKNRIDFRKLDRNSPNSDIEAIINETYNTVKILTDAIKDTKNLVDYLAEDTGRASDFTTTQNTLATYANNINTHLSSLATIENTIKNNKQTFSTSNLDIQSSELSVKQKENALQDAKDSLADYYIRAPFSGTIASVLINNGDSVSSGSVVASLITPKQIAEIPFNEVDVAKIKIGQKSTLTFDAIPDLTISGVVAQIDSVGTVSSGVVNYNVKISFDTNDDRIKPSMSVSASVITDMAQDVVMVPNSAVKTKNGSSFVEMFNTTLPDPLPGVQGSPSVVPPRRQKVEVGISNDTSTQIISGIKEGDKIVIKTILSTTATTTAPSIFSAATGNRAGAGASSAGGAGNAARALRGN